MPNTQGTIGHQRDQYTSSNIINHPHMKGPPSAIIIRSHRKTIIAETKRHMQLSCEKKYTRKHVSWGMRSREKIIKNKKDNKLSATVGPQSR